MGCSYLSVCGRLDGQQVDRSGRGIEGAIDEEDGLRMGDVFGELGGPLRECDYAKIRLAGEALLGAFGKPKADAVISAQRVAAGEDEASGWRNGQRCTPQR